MYLNNNAGNIQNYGTRLILLPDIYMQTCKQMRKQNIEHCPEVNQMFKNNNTRHRISQPPIENRVFVTLTSHLKSPPCAGAGIPECVSMCLRKLDGCLNSFVHWGQHSSTGGFL